MEPFKRAVKRTVMGMLLIWCLGSLILWSGDQIGWLIGFQIGSLVGLIDGCTLVLRLMRAVDMEEKAAIRVMQANTMMRVALIFLALVLAVKLSADAFGGCVLGIGCMYIGKLTVLICENRHLAERKNCAGGDTDK